MKAQICSICLNSDMLCMACKRKLDEGKITESDVKFSRMINEAAKSFRPLDGIAIKKVIENRDLAVIVCGRGDKSRLIGREGSMIRKLSKSAGKSIRVVEETSDMKEFIQDLISPVPVLGMNVLYANGNEVLKIMIPKDRSIPLPKASLVEIIRMVFGKNATIASE